MSCRGSGVSVLSPCEIERARISAALGGSPDLLCSLRDLPNLTQICRRPPPDFRIRRVLHLSCGCAPLNGLAMLVLRFLLPGQKGLISAPSGAGCRYRTELSTMTGVS